MGGKSRDVETGNERLNDVVVAIATYNEIQNLPRLLDGIEAACTGIDILVIDDNSPDGTGQWCQRECQQRKSLQVIHRPKKMGLGSAAVSAFEWAIERDYRFVATMDADFSHDPKTLAELIAIAKSDDVDVTIGSRYVSGGRIQGWPIHRRIGSRLVNRIARWRMKLRPHDISGAFRVYRTNALKKIDLRQLSHGYAYLEEILWHLKQVGGRMREVPIVFRDRERGKSKINFREAVQVLRSISRSGRKK